MTPEQEQAMEQISGLVIKMIKDPRAAGLYKGNAMVVWEAYELEKVPNKELIAYIFKHGRAEGKTIEEMIAFMRYFGSFSVEDIGEALGDFVAEELSNGRTPL